MKADRQKKPSRKGTVVDKLIQRLKVDKVQENYENIKIGEEELDNVFTLVCFGAEVSAMEILLFLSNTVVILHGAVFGEYSKTLMLAQSPVSLRCGLNNSFILSSTLSYGCEVWQMTILVQRMINNICTK